MTLSVRVGEDAKTDLAALPIPLRAEAFKWMLKLQTAPKLGQLLGEHSEVGDLSDCRKIYFNGARHRIVYRLAPNEQAPARVDVVAVGARASLRVYLEAARRLGRTPGADAPSR